MRAVGPSFNAISTGLVVLFQVKSAGGEGEVGEFHHFLLPTHFQFGTLCAMIVRSVLAFVSIHTCIHTHTFAFTLHIHRKQTRGQHACRPVMVGSFWSCRKSIQVF